MLNKYIVITPKYGLCNQLLCISKGIIIGIITNRNVIFKSFQLDFRDDNNTCDFHDIIDMEHLKRIIYNKNIHIYSLKIDCKKIITNTNQDLSYITDFIPLLLYQSNFNERY